MILTEVLVTIFGSIGFATVLTLSIRGIIWLFNTLSAYRKGIDTKNYNDGYEKGYATAARIAEDWLSLRMGETVDVMMVDAMYRHVTGKDREWSRNNVETN